MRSILTTIIFTIAIGFSFAQLEPVNIQIMVQPPYSTHFEDYIIYENKVVLVLTGKPNPSMQPYQVYFKGALEGSNGVMIRTEESYKPASPVEVPAGGTITIQGSEIDFFSSEHLTLSGVDENDLLFGDGLPEGYYHICIKAFDYDTDEPASPDEPLGCSPEFGVFHIDPPQIMLPMDGSTITPTESQNIAFTWTIPVNSPLNTEYILTLTELLEGQNPNDAADALTYPPLFETSVSTNSYVYSMADPILEEGRTYVARVRAYDPLNAVVFKNDGYSEVHTFDYRNLSFVPDIPVVSVDTGISITDIVDIVPPVYNFPPAFQSTSICGKIHYQYPEYGDPRDDEAILGMNTATVKLIVDYTLVDPENGNLTQSTDLNDYNHGTNIPAGHILATTTTDQNGSYCFEYLSNIELGQIGDYIVPGVKLFSSVPLFRVLRVEIEAPHTNYYEQYSKNAYIVNFGETVKGVDFVFNVEQVNLDVNLDWKAVGFIENSQLEYLYHAEDAVGIPVYLLRKVIFPSQTSPFPQFDGYPNDHESITPYLDISPNLKIVGSTTTKKVGTGSTAKSIASFKQVVLHNNPVYQYYVYVAPAENNVNNFNPVGPVLLDFHEIYQTNVGEVISVSKVEITPNNDYDPIGINPVLLKTGIDLDFNFPKIEGKVVLEAGNSVTPLSGVDLLLEEIYIADNSDGLEYYRPVPHWQEKQLADNIESNACFCTQYVRRLDWSAGDGKYAFSNLATLHNYEEIKENVVALKAIKPGYVLAEQEGRLNDKTLLTAKKLRIGEKMDVLIIMKHGAKVKGKVVDAESGERIVGASITIAPEGTTMQTNHFGYFNDLPARKLSGQEQLLVIEKAGYIKDTFKVIIDQAQMDLGVFEIFEAKRRLKVTVRDHEGKIPQYTSVKIKDVTRDNGSPMADITDTKGEVIFIFKNSEENHLVSVGDLASHGHWEISYTNIAIPVQKDFTLLNIKLKQASCISGIVYAGESNDVVLHDAIVKQEKLSFSYGGYSFSQSTPIDTMVASSYQGWYGLYNIPLSAMNRKYVAAKAESQYIGDRWTTVLNEPKDRFDCVKHDFHLTVYNDMDITKLMGFPIYITDLVSEGPTKARIRGGFSKIPSNSHFSIDQNATLDFDGEVTIIAQPLQPGDTIPKAKSSTFPIRTIENDIDIKAKNIIAELKSTNGIGVFPEQSGSLNGVIKGKVKLKNEFFNVGGVDLTEIFVLDPENEVVFPVFRGKDGVEIHNWPTTEDFHLGNKDGNDIEFDIYGFTDATASVENSIIEDSKIKLNTVLHTDIEGISPRDIELNIGEVIINENSIDEINGSAQIDVQIDKWNLISTDWIFNNEGLVINNGAINAIGLSVNTSNFKLKENSLDGSLATFDFQNVKLAGTKNLNVVSQDAGFNYIMVDAASNSYAYQITIPKNGESYGAYLDDLPGMAAEDKLAFRFVNLKSDGNSDYPLFSSETILLHDLVSFRPQANSSMHVTAQSFGLRGSLLLDYPLVPDVETNIGFTNINGQLEFGMYATGPINYTKNKLQTKLNITDFSHHLLMAEGTVEEPNAFPKTNVILTHNPQKIQVDIKEGEEIEISEANYFDEVIGEMHVDKTADQWSPFWFEGYPRGMKGISDNNPEKMKFTVNGVVTANDEEVSVKKVDVPFGEMSLTYDMVNSELTGFCEFDAVIGGLGVDGAVETCAGNNGWYFQATGNAQVPNYGAMGLYALFGDYNGSIDMINAYGGYSCLPPSFTDKVKGFLISGSITKTFVDVSMGLPEDGPVLGVLFGVDVSLATRFYTSFDEQGTTFGLNVKLYGDAFAIGSVPGFKADAHAQALIGIGSTYNTSTKYFAANGCGGVGLVVKIEQWNPVSGWETFGSFDVGLSTTISGDSNGGFDYSLIFDSCPECD